MKNLWRRHGVGASLLILTLALSACQLAPTKTYETAELTAETVLVDARSRFAFGSSRLPNSVNLIWSDFAKSPSQPGILDPDLTKLSRRLAMLGLTPKKPVVIVGEGLKGNGEEGRIAWMLLYLGFPKVQTAELESLGVRRATSFEKAPTKNAPMWTAHPDRALQVEAKELLLSLKGPRRENFHLIDVRSPKEYFARHGKTDVYVLPDLQALNIEWKEFFTADGRPNRNLRKKLESVQVHPTDRVIVISNHGLRSAAATYALKALGYMNVGNFSGGWDELKAHAHKRIKR